jgi:hypothetical protein
VRIIWCVKHKPYKIMRKPRTDCKTCWTLYRLMKAGEIDGMKLTGETR